MKFYLIIIIDLPMAKLNVSSIMTPDNCLPGVMIDEIINSAIKTRKYSTAILFQKFKAIAAIDEELSENFDLQLHFYSRKSSEMLILKILQIC